MDYSAFNTKPIAFDIGMHNGDDSDYYLSKGLHVVGIDANPSTCRECEERFRDEVAQGRMLILNVGVGIRRGRSTFYVHRSESAFSTFSKLFSPIEHWDPISVDVTRLSAIIKSIGNPYFVKIDAEHYDKYILLDLIFGRVKPTYISSESHSLDIFFLLLCMGYKKFKLVEGATVSERFASHQIKRVDDSAIFYHFSNYASGPFGDDIPGGWAGPVKFLRLIMDRGMGWFDIHARI